MDQLIPTAAVYAGSLARTYEYRTIGVPTPPQLCWSFSLKPGAQITCPLLVSQNRVYVADSVGYVTALDAHSGDLAWSFPTDWVEHSKERVHVGPKGVTAFCLEEAFGYVASARGTLYELDLPTGQVLRSWHAHHDAEEGENDEALLGVEEITGLFIHRGDLFLLGRSSWGDSGTYRLDRRTGEISVEIPLDQYGCDYPPTVYRDPRGQPDLIFGFYMYNNSGDTIFRALDLSEAYPDGFRDLWVTGSDLLPEDGDPLVTSRWAGALLKKPNTLVMDSVLYALGIFTEWKKKEERVFSALLALDLQSGVVKWRCEIPLRSIPIQLVAASHQVFVVMKDRVRSIDVQAHQPRWTWKAAFPVRHALVADELLYVLGAQGEIVALEAATGATRWRWQGKDGAVADFTTIDNNTLFLALPHAIHALSS